MIVYTCISRAKDATILVENSPPELKNNASQVALSLMQHLRDHPEQVQDRERKTFVHRNEAEAPDFFSNFIEVCSSALGDDTGANVHYFHVYAVDGVYYTCLGDDPDLRMQKVAFAYLEQIQKEFTKLYKPRRIANANAYSMDKAFKPNIRSSTHYYNMNADKFCQDERVQSLLAQVSDMKKVMGRNMNLLLDRGDQLDRMMDKSDGLLEDAAVFRRQSKRMKDIMWRRYMATYSVFVAAGLLLFYFFLAGFCGIAFQYCRRDHSGGGGEANGGN